MSKTIRDYLGLDCYDRDKITGKELSHREKYGRLVNDIGFDLLHKCLPYDDKTLRKDYKKDVHFNNTSISAWDRAGGFLCEGMKTLYISSPASRLFVTKLGINTFSCSDMVCLLKECARMVCEMEDEQS